MNIFAGFPGLCSCCPMKPLTTSGSSTSTTCSSILSDPIMSQSNALNTVTAVSAAHHGYDDPIPFPFPSPSTPCGDQQSTKLLKTYIGTSDGHRIDDLNDLSRVPFNAQVSFHLSLSRLHLFYFSSIHSNTEVFYLRALSSLYFVYHPL